MGFNFSLERPVLGPEIVTVTDLFDGCDLMTHLSLLSEHTWRMYSIISGSAVVISGLELVPSPSHRKVSRNSFLHLTEALPLLAMLGRNSIVKPIAQDEILVGCVCTNQARKNLDLACETIALLARDYKIRFWLHTDTLERAWSIPSLLIDYGILDRTLISLGFLPDYKMAAGYSACNVTLGVGSEGWGIPLAESLACGTPVIHTSYAGGADIVPREMQVDPIAFYKEGSYSSMRPVYRAEDWAAKALGWTGRRASLDPKYDWKNNWIGWEKWFREGIA